MTIDALFQLMLYLMLGQMILGAFDTIVHHEIMIALPRDPSARLELSIHGARSILYGCLFVALAWWQWRGAWAVLLAAVMLIEIALTLWDFVIEDRTRVLPESERITHTILALNAGAIFFLFALTIVAWWQHVASISAISYGWISVALTIGGAAAVFSGLRDAAASRALARDAVAASLVFGDGQQRLLITGATGFIGTALVNAAVAAGQQVTVLSRKPAAASRRFAGKVRVFQTAAELTAEDQFDVIVHLAGANVFAWPWFAARKRSLLQSRLGIAEDLLAYLARAKHRPRVWIQASAVGFYPTTSDAAIDESHAPGSGFAAELCQSIEAAAMRASTLGVRVVNLRFGLVMGRTGGVLPTLLLATKLTGGTVIGSGTQRVAWIHIDDVLNMISHAATNSAWHGAFNAVAPQAPSYQQFAKALAHATHRPTLWRVPAVIMRIGLGERAPLLIEGAEILPKRALELGFVFRHQDIKSAMLELA
jgi:uncharacterized protein